MGTQQNGRSVVRALGPWLLLLLALVPAALQAQSVARAPFSGREREELSAGKLVSRPSRERRGDLRLIGGASWQVVRATPDALFRALLDTDHYPRMFPGLSRAELVSSHETLRRVRFEHKKGPLGVSYRLALQIDAQRRDITFKLNDPLDSSLRAAWGFLSVREFGVGKTLLSYGVMADPGDGLVVGLVRGVIHDWLLKVPQTVRWFVEGKSGRALYGSGALAR